MVPVTFGTQVTAEYDADGAGRHLANLRRERGMSDTAERAVLGGEALDVAIEHARAALAALLRVAAGDEGSPLIAEARAQLATLLDHRIDLAAARLDDGDAVAVAAARADRDEAIAVSAALLYWLPPGDPAWPEVALTVGRLSYDRYRDPWPGAEPPDPDDLDAACDLLLRGARTDEADERTALYLVLALRDRQRLLPTPADAIALTAWAERLLTFPDAGGLPRPEPLGWSIPKQCLPRQCLPRQCLPKPGWPAGPGRRVSRPRRERARRPGWGRAAPPRTPARAG